MGVIYRYFIFCIWLVAIPAITASALTEAEAVKLSRQYLASADSTARMQLLKRLNSYPGNIDRAISQLLPVPPKQFKQGLSGREEFSIPAFRKRYPEAHLYYYVPSAYDPAKPTGLLIIMHGGGTGTPPEMAETLLAETVVRAGLIDSLTYIAVAPSAPPDPKNSSRWTIPAADDYLGAVITESGRRFNLDSNRVVLAGHSMGGMGAFGLGLRMADRFSAVCAHSGSWTTAYWKAAEGTPFFIIHGARDAVPPGDPYRLHRPKYTDTLFGRLADSLFTAHGLEHIYAEHPYGHSFWDAFPEVKRFGAWMTGQTRDPYQRRVTAATPADGRVPSPHNRWVTILETGDSSITFDGIAYYGKLSWEGALEDWNNSGIRYQPRQVKAGVVEAEYRGSNRFEVKTTNVRSFELWLHPNMEIDFARPVTVSVNGKEITRKVRPSLAEALQSYERRHDWGLIYWAKVIIEEGL